MSKFAKGTQVQQVVTPIVGTVADYSVDSETGKVQVGVEWEDAAGDLHKRFFAEHELAAFAPPAPTK